MHLLKVVFAATTTLFSIQTPVQHLLEELACHEKSVAMIDHHIRKAEYQEKNPHPGSIFESTIPTVWFGHSCGQECAESFMELKARVHKLHAASAANKFKIVCQLLKEYPELADFVDECGNTILHHASKGKHAHLTIALLCLKPQLTTIKNKQGQTPMHLALIDNPRKIGLFVKAAYAKARVNN